MYTVYLQCCGLGRQTCLSWLYERGVIPKVCQFSNVLFGKEPGSLSKNYGRSRSSMKTRKIYFKLSLYCYFLMSLKFIKASFGVTLVPASIILRLDTTKVTCQFKKLPPFNMERNNDIWTLCKTNLGKFSFCRDSSLVGRSGNYICCRQITK